MTAIRPSAFCAALLFLTIAAAGTAGAGEKAPELRLVAGDGTVDVFDRDGRLLQSLPFDGESPDDDNRAFFAVAEDMDFDGCPDVRILYSRGMVNLFYDCWLWRPAGRFFARRDDMRDLSNPSFDPETRSVRVYERGSATTHAEGELAWEDGELVWLSRTTIDEDGENGGDGYVVVTRHFRGLDGELRQVVEMPHRITETDEGPYPAMDDAYYRPELPGLNLVLDASADTLDIAVLRNGEWWRRCGLPDGTLSVESRRLPAQEYGEEAVERLIRVEWPLARGTRIAPFPELAARTSYPAYKAEFLDDSDGDARRFAAALLFADEWSFWFVVEAPADGARRQEDLDALLLDIEYADPANGDFLPFFGLPVYIAGPEPTLRIRVMEALIRIKKLVGPENDSRSDTARIAYRYDGPARVAGRPALCFSFGADSWERFAAERYFAVDEEGTVYEMDALSGGNCWEWDDRGESRAKPGRAFALTFAASPQ